MDNNHLFGVILGAILGVYKSIVAMVTSLTLLNWITWQQAIDTGSLALIGGVCGWIGAEGAKWIKKFYKERKK